MKPHHLIVVLLCFTISQSKASKITPQEYIKLYKRAAVSEMKKSGVPASITLAQGMLESAYGNSRLARKAKNHFGIKCHGDWKGPTIRKDDDAKNECFRKYKSVWESFHDHSVFLRRKSRYAFLFEYKTTDYKAWAKGLKKAGYATNPKYPKLLIDLIEKYDLNQYDRKQRRKDKRQDRSEKKVKEKNAYKEDAESQHDGQHEAEIEDKKQGPEVITVSRIKLSDNYVQHLIVRQGDNMRSLSKETGVSGKRLLKYNERSKGNLRVGEKFYLQPKKRGATSKYYVVTKGETLYQISQRFAVTMKSIKERNRLGDSNSIQAGQKLKLRGRKVKL